VPTPLANPGSGRTTRPTLAGTHGAFLATFGNRGTLLWSTHLSAAAVNPARTDDAALRSILVALCASIHPEVARFGDTVSADVARSGRATALPATTEAGLAA
jgi:hypothetical protein